MRTYGEIKHLAEPVLAEKEFKRNLRLEMNVLTERKRGIVSQRPSVKREETELEKVQPGQKSLASQSLVVLTRKAENLTREKILEATLKLQARRLEIPVEHRSALE